MTLQMAFSQTDFRTMRRVLGYLPKEFNAIQFSQQQQGIIQSQWKTLQSQNLMEYQRKQRMETFIVDLLNQEQRFALSDQKRNFAYKGINKAFGNVQLTDDQELQMYRYLEEAFKYPSFGVETPEFKTFGYALLTDKQLRIDQKRKDREQLDGAKRAAKFEDRWEKKIPHAEARAKYFKKQPARKYKSLHRKVWKKMSKEDRQLVDSLRVIYRQRLDQIQSDKNRSTAAPDGNILAPNQLAYHRANLDLHQVFPNFEPYYKFAYGFGYDPRKADFILKTIRNLRDKYYANDKKVQKKVDKQWAKMERKQQKILKKYFPESDAKKEKTNRIPEDMEKLQKLLPLFIIQ